MKKEEVSMRKKMENQEKGERKVKEGIAKKA